jgi:hypothetical protein
VEIAQVLRAWYGIMQLFTWGSWWKRWAAAGISTAPYSSELHPAERMLEEIRRWVEGRRYESIEAKQAAVGEFAKVESREAGLIAGGWALYS